MALKVLIHLVIFYNILTLSLVFSLSSIEDNDIESLGACANCANSDMSVSELTEARLEFVKQLILKKLRLSKKPSVAVPVNSLPMPVAQGQTLSEGTDKPQDFDNYYGRTEQKIIFPVEGEWFDLKQ